MKIGSLVAPFENSDCWLSSGCCAYDAAVVVSVEPFVLISETGDMLWRTTVELDQFAEIGTASPASVRNVLGYMSRNTWADLVVGEAGKQALEAIAAADPKPTL